MFLSLQGFDGTWAQPIELVYRYLPRHLHSFEHCQMLSMNHDFSSRAYKRRLVPVDASRFVSLVRSTIPCLKAPNRHQSGNNNRCIKQARSDEPAVAQ